MVERGKSSRAREEPWDIPMDVVIAGHLIVHDVQIPVDREQQSEQNLSEYTDIFTVMEQLVEQIPPQPAYESEEEEIEEPLEAESPVQGGPVEDQVPIFGERLEIGRVLRPYSDDKSEDLVTDDDEPTEYVDGIGTTTSDIIEELITKNDELEDLVRHLEEQNQVH